ncbi:DMT family transporter [Streptomyces sp. NPDC091212]|uniref:DMT family transporter n=1 Tax=Streptomyces sp. NPDC091212 TaxID=3155191 RepID=UPI0034493CDC
MSALALSVLLSLVSAIVYASGAILQERVATATPDRPYAPLHHGVWWAAVALNGLGAVLHVAALAFGPLSLVQPLGALTIVFALPLAALFVGRGAGRTAWRGAIMTTAGLAGLLALTGSTDAHSLDGLERVILTAATFAGVGLLFLTAQLVHRPAVRSLLLAGSAGVAFGIGSVFTKTVAVDWTSRGATVQVPSLLVIAALAALGLLLSQASYRGAGLAAPLAAVTVVNPVVAAAVGITLFGEGFRYGLLGTLLALGAGVLTAGGLILLTSGPRPERAGYSEAHSAGPQVGEGVDVGSVTGPRTHLEVEMRSRAVAGGS